MRVDGVIPKPSRKPAAGAGFAVIANLPEPVRRNNARACFLRQTTAQGRKK